jgi:hypothetical protein
MFRPAPAILRVVVIKYQVKLFKNSVIKVITEYLALLFDFNHTVF